MSQILSLNPFKMNEDIFSQKKVKLCELDTVCFYWADSDESCLNLAHLIATDPTLNDQYQEKVRSLDALGNIPIWIKSKNKVTKKTMFDLYHDHILGLDTTPISTRLEVSFLSYTGPYNSMVLSELFHPVMYQQFIMVLLLTGKLSRREFRLRFKTRLILEQNQSVHLVNLEQMSPKGILLSSEKPFIEGSVNFFLDYHVLQETKAMNLDELKGYISSKSNNFLYSANVSSRIPINTKGLTSQVKFDFMKRKVFYYFISFDRFQNDEAASTLKDFVGHSKDLISETFKKAS